MIGEGYWATGITVKYGYSGGGMYGWSARVDFCDDGWTDNQNTDTGAISTEGMLHTRYFVREGINPDADALTAAVDAVKRDADRLGIDWGADTKQPPTVCYLRDGEDKDWPPPDGWREMVNAQARRLGWESFYREQAEQGR